jgi:hypothetical protein
MSTFFDFTYNLNTQESQNEVLDIVKKNRVVLPIPQSHLFTDLSNLNESEAFGPVGTTNVEREKKFRITSKFDLGTGVKKDAYATVNGLLFICRHGDSTDKVNVFLKPSTGKICDIGVKIKYFVYRGLLKDNFFQDLTTQTKLINSTSADATKFIKKVWDEFLEFNFPDNQNSDDIDFFAEQLGFKIDEDPNSILGYKFKKDINAASVPRNLGLIARGQKIGAFQDNIGFEIVLDYGDSEFEKTETGFQLDLDYAMAKECVFNLNTDEPNRNENGTSGNIPLDLNQSPIVSEKIFRENIFHFIDPAAFYGAHIIGKDGNTNKGKIFYGPFVEQQLSETKYSTKEDIHLNILQKFINTNKIYLYILCKRGRSLNFYNPISTPISINSQPQSYHTNNWPVRIIETGNIEFNLLFNGFNTSGNDDLLFSKDTNDLVYWNGFGHKKTIENQSFIFKKPSLNNHFLANYIFLNFAGDVNNQYHLENFGPVKLEPIFDINTPSTNGESESFLLAPNAIQWISYLKPKILTINNDAFLFETKVVFWGFQPTNSSTDPRIYRTRLYIFSPSEMSQEYINSNINLKSTAYVSGYGLISNNDKQATPIPSSESQNFGKLIFNDQNIFIWQGKIKDGTSDVTVLSLRHILGEELPKYNYQIGVTYDDILDIQEGLPVLNYNKYFKLEEVTPLSGSDNSFKKYKLGIDYEDLNGNTHTHFPTTDIYVYTIDNRFFSTIKYADESPYHNLMGQSTLEFLPKDNWNGEFGYDWMRKTSNSNATFPSYDTIVGTNPTQTDGNDDSIIPFDFDYFMYNSLKVNEYNSIPINWKLSSIPSNPYFPNSTDTDSEYFTPYLSLEKDKTAILKVRVKVKTKPDKLFFRYDSAKFEILCKKVSTNDNCGSDESIIFQDNDNTKYDRQYTFYSFITDQEDYFRDDIEFTITCKEILKEDVRIDIVSKEKLNGKDVYRLAGRLIIVSNEPITQELLFIPTTLLFPGETVTKQFTPTQLRNQKPLLEKFLGQSCINANVKIIENSNFGNLTVKAIDDVQDSDMFYLNLTNDKHFNQTFNDSIDEIEQRGHYVHKKVTSGNTTFTIRAGYEKSGGLSEAEFLDLLPKGYKPIKEYLLNKLPSGLTIPLNTMVVFFVNNQAKKQILPLTGTDPDNSDLSDSYLGGFSSGKLTDVIIFDLGNNSTVSHEVYHSLGLPHPFNKLVEEAKYNFHAKDTDSIMDYSHLLSKVTRSTYKWHWKIARENSKKYNQR